jgi:hypothetical protein
MRSSTINKIMHVLQRLVTLGICGHAWINTRVIKQFHDKFKFSDKKQKPLAKTLKRVKMKLEVLSRLLDPIKDTWWLFVMSFLLWL